VSDIEDQRDFLLRSLRDLDAEYAAGDLDAADYATLRDDYTARAADVLREVQSPPTRARPSEGSSRRRTSGRVRAMAIVTLIAMGAGLAGFAVSTTAGERTARAPASGTITEGSTDRIARAQSLVSAGKILDAVKVYDEVLRDDPDNPVALAQRGWLISRVDPSLIDSGLSGIDRAIAVDPAYPDAYFFRGMILLQAKNEPALAAEAFQKALDAHPPPALVTGIRRLLPPKPRGQATPATRSNAAPAAPATTQTKKGARRAARTTAAPTPAAFASMDGTPRSPLS